MALEGITVLLCQKQRHFCGLDSDMCSKHGVTNQGMIFSFFFLRQTKWKTPDKFWFSLQGIPPPSLFFFFYTRFTNQKTFTLILTWSSNKTSGNGMAERQQHGKHLIAWCVGPPENIWPGLNYCCKLLQLHVDSASPAQSSRLYTSAILNSTHRKHFQ